MLSYAVVTYHEELGSHDSGNTWMRVAARGSESIGFAHSGMSHDSGQQSLPFVMLTGTAAESPRSYPAELNWTLVVLFNFYQWCSHSAC